MARRFLFGYGRGRKIGTALDERGVGGKDTFRPGAGGTDMRHETPQPLTGAGANGDAKQGGSYSGAVITGGLVRTSENGQRVEMSSETGNALRFFSGHPAETQFGVVLVDDGHFPAVPAGYRGSDPGYVAPDCGYVRISPPVLGGQVPAVELYSAEAGIGAVFIRPDATVDKGLLIRGDQIYAYGCTLHAWRVVTQNIESDGQIWFGPPVGDPELTVDCVNHVVAVYAGTTEFLNVVKVSGELHVPRSDGGAISGLAAMWVDAANNQLKFNIDGVVHYVGLTS